MSNLIERQAAIDAVCLNNYRDITLVNGNPYTRGYRDGVLAKENDCIENIMNLPSAEPEPYEDAVSRNAIIQKLNMMDRYVSEELRLCDTDKKFPKNEVFIVDDVYEEIVENLPSAQPEQRWIPCSERLPEEDHWLGGSGKQFSDNVLVSIYNSDDEDEWVDVSQTIDGEWRIELLRQWKIVAWMPLPKPYKEGVSDD